MPAGRVGPRREGRCSAGGWARRLRDRAGGAGQGCSRPGAEGLLEVGVLLKGDLDRSGDHVRPVGAAAEVLRVLLHSSDELDGKPEAHGLELDRDLGLNATSVHGPPSPKPSASASCLGWGKGCAGTPAGPAPGTR